MEKSLGNSKMGIRKGLLAVAPEIDKEVVRLIRHTPKTGRLYSFGSGHYHQASAPGEAPAELTGALARSIGHQVSGHNKLTVGNRVSYGHELEFGGGRTAPRPHLRPAALSKARELGQAIQRHVKIELGKK